MAKATHSGECQICGKRQKLPNGLLSNHGYSVKWNMFLGICPGAIVLPYELSCDAIKENLVHVQSRIDNLEARLLEIQLRTGSIGYVMLYKSPTWEDRTGGYYWEELEFIEKEAGYGSIGYVLQCGKQVFNHGLYSRTVEGMAREGDQKYIKHVLSPRIRGLKNYKQWAIDRIANWQLKDLTHV
jgi:hypothetical protein